MNGCLTNVNPGELMLEFCRAMNFPKECIGLIDGLIEFRTVSDDTVLIAPGDVDYNIYFILSGFGVGYCITEEGDRKCLYLQKSSYVLCSLVTLAHGKPSEYCCTMQKGGLLAVMDDRRLMELCLGNPEIFRWYATFLKSALLRFERKAAKFITKDARHRLLDLYDESPEIFTNALCRQIASFIGVTPVHLSRILSFKVRH